METLFDRVFPRIEGLGLCSIWVKRPALECRSPLQSDHEDSVEVSPLVSKREGVAQSRPHVAEGDAFGLAEDVCGDAHVAS